MYELYHHGIKGQKWGVRRYQKPDGDLIASRHKRRDKQNNIRNKRKNNIRNKKLKDILMKENIRLHIQLLN